MVKTPCTMKSPPTLNAALLSPARSALRIPYLAVRTPLGLLDEQVVVRVFGAESGAHRSLLRGLHTLDALAASALASTNTDAHVDDVDVDPVDNPDGDVREPSAVAADQAEPIEPEPIEPEQIEAEPIEAEPIEAEPIEAEERLEIQQLADTLLAHDELAPRSGELAENDELRRVQAEIRAKQEIETEHGQL